MRFTVAFLLAALVPTIAQAQTQTPTPAAPPIRVIIEVPNDAAGQAFVKEKLAPILPATQPSSAPPPASPAAPPAPPAPPTPPAAVMEGVGSGLSALLSDHLMSVRARALGLLAAAPRVPGDLRAAARAFAMNSAVDALWLFAAAALFVAGGFAAQRLVFWSTRSLFAYIIAAPADTVQQRLRIQAIRVSVGIAFIVAFLIGSLGAFLLFPWPPIFREIVLVLLAGALAIRLAVALGRVIIAPGARHLHFRILPLSTPLAWFWYHWLTWMTGLVVAGWGFVAILEIVGVTEASRHVVAVLWLFLFAIAFVVMIWRRHFFPEGPPLSRAAAFALSALVALAWFIGSLGLSANFTTLMVICATFFLIRAVNDGVRNVARLDDPSAPSDPTLSGRAVVVERALRALLIVAAALIIARVWAIDLGDIAMGETALTRTVRAALRIVIILLAADVVWKLARTLIDSNVTAPVTAGEDHGYDDSPAARRRQRLNTLLPILRNILLVLIFGIAILMVLDAIGVQIGPLLAGAGVVGIAIGFGAQTIVKDVISGIFYLLDDAFRVGEYIQTSSHKGTVESFSLRSVKLRHHRGPITTVPFGDLGAVENMSRDYVIDKVTIGVPYDTDLDKVRKLIKQIGKDLASDPELAPVIIDTLKMQGVEQMGEFSIQIRLKMTTKPGEQFVVRRRAYALIKKAFEANGIHFAVPTVQVAGGGSVAAAVAADHAVSALRQPADPGQAAS